MLKRGYRVWVGVSAKSKAHFDSEFEAIVEYSHSQKFGGDLVDDYALIVLDDNGRPINFLAWYQESEMVVISDDIKAGLKIIEAYNFPEDS